MAVTQFLPAIVVSLIACTTHAASYVFTNIADSTGIFAPSGGPVGVGIGSGPLSINNNGTVAFLGGLDNGRVGVFTGPDPVADKVIASNEPLFGSTLVGIIPGTTQHNGAIAVNDSGQIAFHYQLADGRQGIAVATPIPEPSLMVTLLMGAVLLLAHSRMACVWRSLCKYALLLAATVVPFSGSLRAAAYVFTNIADSSGIFAPSGAVGVGIGDGFLSINNFGTVAFSSLLDDGRSGVFKGTGGSVTSIALSGGPMFSLVAGASINASGTVAFVGQLAAGGSGIFTGNGGALTPVALSSEGFAAFGAPTMNDAGRVAIGVSFAGGRNAIFLRGGGQPEAEVVSEGATFSAVSNFTINSFGTVAFRGAAGASGIFTGNGGPITTIALTPMPQGITPSINDLGTVVFAADSGSTVGTRLLLGNGGPVTTFVSNAGPFAAFGIYPAINNNGTVAFLAGLDVGPVGLFAGPDPVADKVIRIGESLFGSTLTTFSPADVQSPADIDLNDAGQIAFHYQLADGRQGIAVATPTPEPSAVVLLLAGTSLLLGIKSANRTR